MSLDAVDVAVVSVGAGVFLVCLAHAVKIVSDVRLRSRITLGRVEPTPQDKGVLDRRLQDFQNARFGRPLSLGRPRLMSKQAPPTWPVNLKREAKK